MTSAAKPDALPPQAEADFQRMVVDMARKLGWTVFSLPRSAGVSARTGKVVSYVTSEGWPDLVLWRGTKAILRELKSDKGKVSPAQQAVGDGLLLAGWDWSVWRPRDWLEIEATLRGELQ